MIQTAERSGYSVESDFDFNTRRYYDTVTWLAEVLPGSMRTPFEYDFKGSELYADCGSPMGPIFDKSIEDAKSLPNYEYRRRLLEKDEYRDMIAMMRGELPNTMVVVSDFPPELMNSREDVGGYNVKRKQTMLRVITKTEEGRLRMISQSLDRSDRKALESIYHSLGFTPSEGEMLGQRMHLDVDKFNQEFLVDRLTGIYDRSLGDMYGGQWYAGERSGVKGNTYDFVCSQQDLISAYLVKSKQFTGGSLDYNLAAAMKARFEGRSSDVLTVHKFASPVAYILADQEMNQAGAEAQSRGEVFSGCGASVSLGIGGVEGLRESGFGNRSDEKKSDSDKYGSLKFKCPKSSCGYINTRPRNKLIPRCQRCKADVSC